jgi:hypothetical protein
MVYIVALVVTLVSTKKPKNCNYKKYRLKNHTLLTRKSIYVKN